MVGAGRWVRNHGGDDLVRCSRIEALPFNGRGPLHCWEETEPSPADVSARYSASVSLLMQVYEGVVLRRFSAAQMISAVLFHENDVGSDGLAIDAAARLFVAVLFGGAEYEKLAAQGRQFVQAAARGVSDSQDAAAG